jgi:hypothetical protein
VYSKFRKNKIWKKMKSPVSMRNGRFDTLKCKGKLKKMGVLYTHSSKSPSPFPKLPKKKNLKKKNSQKKGNSLSRAGRGPMVARQKWVDA